MKICLVGNQNSGKTTLFNNLTGMNQKIGNWPGVTVEKKSGIIKNTNYELIDLPGIYSLNPYTEEEKVSVNFILQEKPDIIINIVDATCLERSLYLTTQLLELHTTVIVALNMTDLLAKKGIKIDIPLLKKELQAKVCEISALKQIGIEELKNCIKKVADNNKYGYNKNNILNQSNKCNNCNNCIYKPTSKPEEYEHIATQRYNYISKITEKCMYKRKRWITNTEMLDKIFLNKIFSIPIFIVIMFSIYFLSVGMVGRYTAQEMTKIIEVFSKYIDNLLININTPNVLQSLIVDGALKGISAVLNFIPQLIILFICISILETTGYMSRIAFLLDNFFRKIGLSGKALIPFIIGSGCSVPGIMSTKIIDNSDERKMISILVPFIPCSAKLPIIALLSGYFFNENEGLVSAGLYFLAITIIILSSLILKKYMYINTEGVFISELPDYKLPNIRYITREVKEKTLSFVKRAGTIILLVSVVIWFLISFSTKFEYGINIENSILAGLGKKISWIFYPMLGVNSWELTVSAIQGLIAKEQVVASMSILSGTKFLTKWSSISFVIFNLFSAPCFTAIATMKKQLGSVRKMLIAVVYQTVVAWCLATLIYQFFLLIF